MKIKPAKVIPFHSPPPPGWPVRAKKPTWRGSLGEYVLALEPHTEADPHAVLLAMLVITGNMFGHGMEFFVGSQRHYSNLFGCVVGFTSASRKTTATNEARNELAGVDPSWDGICSGSSTGEGIINAVRDPSAAMKSVWEGRGKKRRKTRVPKFAGVSDKRKVLLETEFGRTLQVINRPNSTLASVFNQAWDGSDLQLITKKDPLKATAPHISLVGNINFRVLTDFLNDTEIQGGWANRILWCCALGGPDIPTPIDFTQSAQGKATRETLAKAVAWVRGKTGLKKQVMVRGRDAEEWWRDELYSDLKHRRPDDLFGDATTRAEVNVMRMAMICAGIERSKTIKRSHLETANALWQYCEDSARFVFSGRDTTGGVSKHGERAQKLLASLRDAGADGLTRTQIMDVVFSKDLPASEITALLTNLKDAKLASMKVLNITDSRGRRRSVERWFAATTEPPGGITG